ncbi:MAG: acetyl-CoA decarbonylase/synthase complex subunit gamma [Oscillospiraceae bacterium]|jgi:acetyl-CoA decarbonylase/synthase complex subunit gamma|nr:acetyl-CoA decarbonylase/synthase complex subunit gamma [Oscillospiraceae bacterium]
MALSGLQIQKLLPKTNCKECGSSTCMAFAMKLAAKKASLDECPYASDEARQVLGAASEPPVKGVKIGVERVSSLGEETVFYRHEKTFVNQTVLAVNLGDDDDLALADRIRDYTLVRVGETLTLGAVAVTQTGSAEAFVAFCKAVYDRARLPLVLRGRDADALALASAAVAGSRSVISGVTADNADALRAVAVRDGHVLAVTADDLDGLCALTAKLKADGFNDLLVAFSTHSLAEEFQTNAIARKAALSGGVKALGYASLRFIDTGDGMTDMVEATTEIAKYGGLVVLPSFDPAQLAPLMTLRQNIYTDPQKPIQVEPKLYAIGEPDKSSPLFVTTNFSLTYFLVSGEIENSGISAWLLVPECEGMSVLTSWAAGKFSGATIGKFAQDIGLESLVDTRTIVIPGYVAQISGELEESLPGFKVLVGPGEAADLESFIKSVLVNHA